MGWLRRWWRRDSGPIGVALADDGTGVVVASCFDPARADSAVLADAVAAGPGGPAEGDAVLLRHHLRLASATVAHEVRSQVEREGWSAVLEDPAEPAPGRPRSVLHPDLPVRLRASRMVALTVRDLARERSRMAGLAQRHRGDVEGYDLLVRR